MKRVRKNNFLTSIAIISAFVVFAVALVTVALVGKEVYADAQSGITEKVPIESIELLSNKQGEVKPGDVINLRVVTTPDYAIETTQHIEYLIVSGGRYIILNGSTITVKDDAITGASFSICAVADGKYSDTLTWTIVGIEIEKINILNEDTVIQQNKTLQLDVEILPNDCTNRQLFYKITSGSEYARINQNGLITVNNRLPRGNIKITVRVESVTNSAVYDEKTYSIYVPTRSLYVTASNLNPKAGETVTLYEQIDATATVGTSDFTILEGEQYVKSREGNVITINDEIEDFDPYILFEYTRDGLTRQLRLDIYISITGISFESPIDIVKQSGMYKFRVVTTPLNATRKNLTFYLSDEENAVITRDGLFTAKVMPETDETSVDVIADIDGITCSTTVIIQKPNVTVTANNYNPTTKSTEAQTVTLTTAVDNVVTTENVTYTIIEGSQYVVGGEIASDGTFTIVTGIEDKDPEITISATYAYWQSKKIIVRPYILVEKIEINNSSIINVEQQVSYDFGGKQYPINARNVNQQLTYLLSNASGGGISQDIAKIDKDGILEIASSAPIGTVINVTILGADGVIATHTVTVTAVYATRIRLFSVTNQNGQEIKDGDTVEPGDVLYFEAIFPENDNPFNVTDKSYRVALHKGTDIATFDGYRATIKPQSQIEGDAYAVLKVVSDQGGNILEDYFAVRVHIAVTDIEYEQKVTEVAEGALLNIDKLLTASVQPSNATYGITYTVDGYATLTGSYVQVNDGLDSGDLTFTVTIKADEKTVVLTYKIYVKAKNIKITANNMQPLTLIDGGENVKLTVNMDKKASDNTFVFKIVRGADLIVGEYSNDVPIALTFNADGEAEFNFTVKSSDNIGADRLIEFEIAQGKTSESIEIEIYKPIENVALIVDGEVKTTSDTIMVDRGKSVSFTLEGISAVSDPNAYDAYIVKKGINDTMFDDIDIDMSNKSMPKVYIPSKMTKGSRFTLKIVADKCGKEFEFTFEIKELSEELFKVEYGKDSSGVTLDKNAPQIWVGRSTKIKITYDGVSLENYGLKIDPDAINFTDGTFKAISSDTARLTINSTASGKSSVSIFAPIVDGDGKYRVMLKKFKIFRPLNGTPSLTNGTITQKTTQLTLGDGTLDTKATYGLDSFKFYGSSLEGVAVTEKGEMTIKTASVSEYPTITLEATQVYNGTTVMYSTKVQPHVHKITFDKAGGSGGTDSIITVNGFCTSITPPTRKGYNFEGYYYDIIVKYAGCVGQFCVYNKDGKSQVNLSNFSGFSQTIYAKWTPWKYTINKYDLFNNEKKYEKTYDDIEYGTEWTFCFDDDANPDWTFEGWFLDDTNVTTNRKYTLPTSSVTKDGQVFTLYSKWTKSSCIAEGTLITLDDGTFKPVEELDGSERLLVWNIHTGTYDSAPILFIDYHGIKTYEVLRLYFDNANYVEVIDNHGFFDITLGKYVFIDAENVKEYIGHTFVTQNGEGRLVSSEVEQKETGSYSPVTFGHLCYYVNGFLSMPANTEPFINIFDVDTEKMRIDEELYIADVELYGLYTYETFVADWADYLDGIGETVEAEQLQAMLPEIMYEAFGGQFLKISIGKGNATWEEITKLIKMYERQLTGGNE